MRCAKCGAENPEELKFCEQCAAPFRQRCAKCGFENSPAARFCGECAAPVKSSPGAASPLRPVAGAELPESISQSTADHASAELEGERKTVTMLFADIKGSMDLIEDLDPEEARAIVDPALKLMMEAVQRYGGYVAQSTGDGILALFGAPLAHEDHPQRALYAALRIQQELKRYSDRTRIEGRLPIQARVGANTGEVVVRSITTGEGRTEYVPVGHSTGIAARMQALAPVGSIAATESVRKLCEGYFLFKSLGPTKVKGVSEPVTVYEVTGLGPLRTRLQRAAARGYTKFAGRQREMETMKHAAELAKAGHGQIVAAVGEAGVGKSRLFHEFKATNQFGWMVLEAFSVSHGKATAYLPVIELLHGYFRIATEDDQRTRREKVNGRIVTLDPALEDTRPYLFGLLGLAEGDDPLGRMDAQIRRRRTQDAIKCILQRESLNQPVMLIFEDLLQIDDETQSLLNYLADSIGTSSILLMVNYRPEYSHSWGSKTYYTQLRVDPLGKESADEMLNALLGSDEGVAPLKLFIAEKSEGSPLFMEEIYQALIEEGVLVRNGAVKITRLLSQLKIPATVQAILAARIDRLPGAEKELLQTLAVIGMQFPLALVREVITKPDDELSRKLSDLQLAEFIYEQPAADDVEFTFKHALTQALHRSPLPAEVAGMP
ncbi:MAG: AAA family ATPase [Deltaproteobacteria bacterium]|nr:AAA family ATPase [Deltaproteobacteria bacterium]